MALHTARTSRFAEGLVEVWLQFDDVDRVLTGVRVINNSDQALRIGLITGAQAIIPAQTTRTTLFTGADQLPIERKPGKSQDGRPYRIAYPWFG